MNELGKAMSRLRLWAWGGLGSLIVLLAASEIYEIAANGLIATDFKGTIWQPAHSLVGGGSSYGLGELAGSVYPPSASWP